MSKKFSELPVVTTVQQAAIMPLVQDGDTVQATVANVHAAMQVNIQEFTVSGTWTKPMGAKRVLVQIVAAGGGGGGGARVASGTACSGGAGGGSGAYVQKWFNGFDLPSSCTVTIGAAGTAGAGATVNGTAGGNGAAGGESWFNSTVTIIVKGGGGGAGGQIAGASGGGGGGGINVAGTNGSGGTPGVDGMGSSNAYNDGTIVAAHGGGCANGAAGSDGLFSFFGTAAGPAGGGISTTPTAFAGGIGFTPVIASNPGGAATGANGTNANPAELTIPGGAGGGGGGNISGTGGNGGTSYRGGGGAGGGSAVNANAGAGSAGGAGYCIVTTYF